MWKPASLLNSNRIQKKIKEKLANGKSFEVKFKITLMDSPCENDIKITAYHFGFIFHFYS